MILTLLGLLVLVAVPLYLWRRPKQVVAGKPDGGQTLAPDAQTRDVAAASPIENTSGGSKVTLAEPRTFRCISTTGGRVAQERCDRLTPIENVLAKAIRANVACAPHSPSPFTVSFVLWVDFVGKKTHLWAGRSGTLKKRDAADLIRCVERALPEPDWDKIVHQYAKYDVNVIATYQAPVSPVVPIP